MRWAQMFFSIQVSSTDSYDFSYREHWAEIDEPDKRNPAGEGWTS